MKQKTVAAGDSLSTKKRVLITAGGTAEPIDQVRAITNHSTGRLGQEIAKAFLAQTTIEIDYITTRQALLPTANPRVRIHLIESTNDLKEMMEELLTSHTYQAVIHSMAVSDFTPAASLPQEELLQKLYQELTEKPEYLDSFTEFQHLFQELTTVQSTEKKISSASEHLLMVLKQNPKIIHLIKQLQPETRLVGFKLLVGVEKEELLDVARTNLKKNQADYVLANDLESINETQHIGYLVSEDGVVATGHTKQEIAALIVEAVTKGA
ncbi:phosphopantothenate--cysteine ligase [Enterococcus sp. JM4C]|uniref:phosphopantothenate--cysteine ligase n=1 Tax=Candidatus Enterococcus huntleyi TaxID=1857217 RepID=UPI00137A1B29|nr:phosphopantothenate--cysteine ligase [Enterococcus sp. JM4C]KAF1295671.1 phosphopantothenate--cysteine ligase [Enterococcus sp. JM4C]